MTRESIDEMLRYCEGLKLKNKKKVLQKALKIYKLLTINFPERKINRDVMLSSCLYVSAILLGEHISQANIARAFNISESTFNKKYKEVVKPLFPAIGKCCKTLISKSKEQTKNGLVIS